MTWAERARGATASIGLRQFAAGLPDTNGSGWERLHQWSEAPETFQPALVLQGRIFMLWREAQSRHTLGGG